MNHVKDKLKAGDTAVGSVATISSEVSFLADSGFDFLLFDTQHSPVAIKQLQVPLAAMRGQHAIPIVRVGDNSAEQICYALDQGAKGIIVPMVNSAAEAESMVKSCKYPFEGVRSSAGIRGEWGEYPDYREYMDAVNDQLLIIPMLETLEALSNLDDIVNVEGVDVLLIGPSDLSINLDVPLDYTNPKYHAALDKIAAKCRDAGVAPGIYFAPPGIDPKELIDKGFQFFTVQWVGWAKAGIEAELSSIR